MSGTPAERQSTVATYLAARPAEDDLVSLCELAALVCEAPAATVNLIDGERQVTVAAYGADGEVSAAHESLGALALAASEDVYLEDARSDPRFAAHAFGSASADASRMCAAVVLCAPGGVPVGTLCVTDTRPNRPLERRQNAVVQRRRMLATLARQVVGVFELSIRTDLLARTNAELARSQQHLAAFAGQISHDLKTPLSATLGFAELLSDLPTVVADQTATQYVQRCMSSSRRMLAMIDDLLGYARFGGTLNRRAVPLDEVLPAVLEDLGEVASRGAVSWLGVDVVADPAQLRALLQNLIGNALLYSREGVPPEVLVTARETADGVELVVSDNGSGIPADRRDEVLLPLARLRTDVAGTGIGLATCQRIVAGHGGSLHIGDAPGGGTAIRILLPR